MFKKISLRIKIVLLSGKVNPKQLLAKFHIEHFNLVTSCFLTLRRSK